ncbi:Nucleotide-binding universal stress protein, UspA family [Natronoarchaeum philippinense]|uniref:Nucleotide-binding universal stress protein, UspA family n=1 Tax=Natronoarchaeum philippinense TaxID=558529 RepID=A0A285P591_NATPI|nr:universal stress protein [Natronoarchaeum philippinense]SNZ16880.1 Nucleotide-binding universal stress protein, UspA family [Natronoarchaeum philippinense]
MAIVAAIDDSDRAATVLAEAQTLAADLDEELHAIHVLERSELVEVLEKDVEGQDLTDNYEVQQVGENLVDRALDNSDPEPNISVRVGDPGTEIAAYADDEEARYVVIGGRQRSPTGKALFGSVTQDVIFDSPAPVINVAIE